MIDIEAKLNCERHIADLTLRIAQLKEGSGAGSDVLASAEFIDLLQQNSRRLGRPEEVVGGTPF